ncbi:MAG: PIN domain-containing protein [Candidatus Competibacteraceae bacterium]|nr:MAG: PIN domain-containing protein [Candidatus Competibacteraceae bacterium]
MKPTRFFLDTAFVQALLNKNDQYHRIAQSRLSELRTAREVWTTEAILIEIGNALSTAHRAAATRFISQCYATPNLHVVPVDTRLLNRGLDLYDQRADKEWGLTDCISFVVMSDQNLTHAMTTDRHFIQAGFRALMRDSESE